MIRIQKRLLRKNSSNRFLVLVDNSIEISNISLTPKDLIDTHHIMTLISRNINRESFIY